MKEGNERRKERGKKRNKIDEGGKKVKDDEGRKKM